MLFGIHGSSLPIEKRLLFMLLSMAFVIECHYTHFFDNKTKWLFFSAHSLSSSTCGDLQDGKWCINSTFHGVLYGFLINDNVHDGVWSHHNLVSKSLDILEIMEAWMYSAKLKYNRQWILKIYDYLVFYSPIFKFYVTLCCPMMSQWAHKVVKTRWVDGRKVWEKRLPSWFVNMCNSLLIHSSSCQCQILVNIKMWPIIHRRYISNNSRRLTFFSRNHCMALTIN